MICLKTTQCIVSKTKDNLENCDECPDNNYCLTFNPELKALVEKSKTDGGLCNFNSEDIALIRAKYPHVFNFKYQEYHPSIDGMRHWMVETYHFTEIMSLLISKDVISKLEEGKYSDEEIELLYFAMTQKYDAALGLQ